MLASLIAPFTRHPATVGESYGEHAVFAGRLGLLMLAAGFAALIHAVLPFAFETTASSIVKRLAQRFENRGPIA